MDFRTMAGPVDADFPAPLDVPTGAPAHHLRELKGQSATLPAEPRATTGGEDDTTAGSVRRRQSAAAIMRQLLAMVQQCSELLEDMRLDDERKRLRARLELRSDRASDMLAMLLDARGAPVSQAALAAEVMGRKTKDFRTRKMIAVYMHDVRRALHSVGIPNAIECERKSGYSINAAAEAAVRRMLAE